MNEKLSIERLKQLDRWARENRIEPCTVIDREHAAELNRIEKLFKKLGLSAHKWKVGDKYYTLSISTAIFKENLKRI